MKFLAVLRIAFISFEMLIATVHAHPEDAARDGRWMWGNARATVTNFVTRKQLVTELEPSSCVVADPTLSPCRNVRQLQLIKPTRIPAVDRSVAPIQAIRSPSHSPDRFPQPIRQTIQPSEHDGGILSWFRTSPLETVVHTLVEPSTIRRHDPHSVVTFSIRGCRPTRLPFDLPLCPGDGPGSARSHEERAREHLDVHYAMEGEQGKGGEN